MKKLTTLLLALMMLLALPVSVFADEDNYDLGKDDDDVSVELYASGTSTYSVYFPKKLDVSSGNVTLTIKAKGDITPDELLNISFAKEDIVLEDQAEDDNKRDDIPLTIEGDFGAFEWDDIADADYANNQSVSVAISHSGILAGSWKTTLPITISLDAKE